MKLLRYVPLSGLLLLTGCALVAGPTTPGGNATLSLLPTVQDGGYRAQTVVNAYTQADINHLQVKLFKVVSGSEQEILGTGGTPLMLDLPQASLSAPVTFSNLNYDTTYRVRSYAYSDAGTSSLISATDVGSYVDVTVTRDDRPTLANLPVKLIDRLFYGQATASTIAVTPGGLTAASSTSISLPSIVATLAGTAESFGSTDGTGTAASFKYPIEIAADGSGNLYVADSYNHTIRKITAAGEVTTLAGMAGTWGSTNGIGSTARFKGPQGMALDGSGNLYVTDLFNHTLRKIVLSTGEVTTLAGTVGTSGSADGTGTAASFNYPAGLAADGSGNLYMADSSNQTIRKIVLSTGEVTTLAGTILSSGSTNGIGTAARFNNPMGLAFDGSGNLYVTDQGSQTLRKIVLSTGEVTTLAGTAGVAGSTDGTGTAARFDTPQGIMFDGSGNLYVADQFNHTIRKIALSTGAVTTFAGMAGISGSTSGTGTTARFNSPTSLATDGSGNLYVADYGNHIIRKIVP